MVKPLTFRDLRRVLLTHDSRFSFRTGKGSEVVLSHPSHRRTCCLRHHGDGDTVGVPILVKVSRIFDLPGHVLATRQGRRVVRAPSHRSLSNSLPPGVSQAAVRHGGCGGRDHQVP